MEQQNNKIDQLNQQIIYVCQQNQQIIDKFQNNNNLKKQIDGSFFFINLIQKNRKILFKLEQRPTKHILQQFIDQWQFPSSIEKPQDPDPDQSLYGKYEDLMKIECQNFKDLIRINQQEKIAHKYLNILRYEIALIIGERFKKNFDLVNQGLIQLEKDVSNINQLSNNFDERYQELQQINLKLIEYQNKPFTFFNTNQKLQQLYFKDYNYIADIQQAYICNKGSLLEYGIYEWNVKVTNLQTPYDLGVVSPQHTSHFNMGNKTAWGIRQDGFVYYKQLKFSGFKQGDVINFKLNLKQKTLEIKINGTFIFTHDDVEGPVHVAFSGGQGAQAIIL